MTQQEFEQGYAERSGISMDALRDLGRFSAPCDCEDLECQGWQIVSLRELEESEKERYMLPREMAALEFVRNHDRAIAEPGIKT